jgi:hypothetical protein
LFVGLPDRSQYAPGRFCDRPSRHTVKFKNIKKRTTLKYKYFTVKIL